MGNWFREECERAKARNAEVPAHARMIVTNPALSAHTRAEHVGKQLAKQGEGDLPRTYVPAATRVSGLAASGLPVFLSRLLEVPVLSVDPAGPGRVVMLPQHSAEAEAAMSAELVTCTLGARQRPELLPDMLSGPVESQPF